MNVLKTKQDLCHSVFSPYLSHSVVNKPLCVVNKPLCVVNKPLCVVNKPLCVVNKPLT